MKNKKRPDIHYRRYDNDSNNPETRKKISKGLKAFWANPENRKRMLIIFNSQEYRKHKSESVNAFYDAHPERRKAAVEWMNSLNSNPEVIRRRAETKRRQNQNRKKLLLSS